MISLFCIPCLRWFDGTSRCLTSQTFFQMPQMFQWRCSSHKNLSDVFHHHLSIIFDNDVTMSINYQLSLIDGSLIIDETINYQRCPRIYLDHFFDARMEKKMLTSPGNDSSMAPRRPPTYPLVNHRLPRHAEGLSDFQLLMEYPDKIWHKLSP